MNWLWLVAVGATDVQFPLWRHGSEGEWSEQHRFSVPRDSDIRRLHEGLLTLLRGNRLVFPAGPLPDMATDGLGAVRLQLLFDENAFVASYHSNRFRLVPDSDTVSEALPVFCPKVEPLASPNSLPNVRPRRDVTIVALNTTRDAETNPGEPIAAGPIVSRYLAERLGLEWFDSGGTLNGDAALPAGVSTWIDILRGRDQVEDENSKQSVRDRLHAILDAWEKESRAARSIAISSGGGVPALKEIIERIAATRYGDGAIRLLLVPERGAPDTPALRYSDKWSEREALRFHCAEALRQGDLIGAYGLARRYCKQPWAGRVIDALGPLLELPCKHENQVGSLLLQPWELRACRVEACLSRGDVAAGIKTLGAFLESAIWALLEKSEGLEAMGLRANAAEERIDGAWPNDPSLGELLDFDPGFPRQHRAANLWAWPTWLNSRESSSTNTAAAKALQSLYGKYLDRSSGPSLKDVRNRLAHGAGPKVALEGATALLKWSGFVNDEFPRDFGNNMMALREVKDLLQALGDSDELLVARVNEQLVLLQRHVWRD